MKAKAHTDCIIVSIDSKHISRTGREMKQARSELPSQVHAPIILYFAYIHSTSNNCLFAIYILVSLRIRDYHHP